MKEKCPLENQAEKGRPASLEGDGTLPHQPHN